MANTCVKHMSVAVAVIEGKAVAHGEYIGVVEVVLAVLQRTSPSSYLNPSLPPQFLT